VKTQIIAVKYGGAGLLPSAGSFFCAGYAPTTCGAVLAFVRGCGGDVDTIGAMAGALWGAGNGAAALPGDTLSLLEDRERIDEVGRALYRARPR
jgi:ADP-ribosylglycohydrolase